MYVIEYYRIGYDDGRVGISILDKKVWDEMLLLLSETGYIQVGGTSTVSTWENRLHDSKVRLTKCEIKGVL